MNYNEIINIEFLGGTDIDVACTEAVELSKKRNAIVNFSFNGIKMEVDCFSLPLDLVRYYHKEMQTSRNIGAKK